MQLGGRLYFNLSDDATFDAGVQTLADEVVRIKAEVAGRGGESVKGTGSSKPLRERVRGSFSFRRSSGPQVVESVVDADEAQRHV